MTITNLGLFKERFTKLRHFNNKQLLMNTSSSIPPEMGDKNTSFKGDLDFHLTELVSPEPSPKFLTFRTSFLAKFCPSSFFSPTLLSTEYVHLGPQKTRFSRPFLCCSVFGGFQKPKPPKEMVQEQILPEIDKQLPKMLRGSVSFPKVHACGWGLMDGYGC